MIDLTVILRRLFDSAPVATQVLAQPTLYERAQSHARSALEHILSNNLPHAQRDIYISNQLFKLVDDIDTLCVIGQVERDLMIGLHHRAAHRLQSIVLN